MLTGEFPGWIPLRYDRSRRVFIGCLFSTDRLLGILMFRPAGRSSFVYQMQSRSRALLTFITHIFYFEIVRTAIRQSYRKLSRIYHPDGARHRTILPGSW
jgi:hypothetical protein